MTKFTVAIKGDDGEVTARSTEDLDDALDWFTNAVTEVMDPEEDLSFASLSVAGQVWGMIQHGGLSPDGEVVQIRAPRASRAA
jgi:hypothetical protein